METTCRKEPFEAIKTYILDPEQAFSDHIREEDNKLGSKKSECGKHVLHESIVDENQRLEDLILTEIRHTNSDKGIAEWTKSFI